MKPRSSRFWEPRPDPDPDRSRMILHRVGYDDAFNAGDMTIHTLRANHQQAPCEAAVNYIIEREGKTILYALDSGWPLDETLSRIAKFRYDLVVVEGTFGYGVDSPEHMNFAKAERLHAWFREKDLLNLGALFCLSHLCPHWTPSHDDITPVMAEKGIIVAHDGMKIE